MGEDLVLALGIAASPFPIVPAILLLFTPRPRPTSLSFLGGWFGGIAVATGVFVLLAGALEPGGGSPTWLSWVRIAVGAALVVYGARQWFARAAGGEPPAWMTSLQDATPRSAVRLALLLSVANPKVVLLAAAAGLDLGTADLTPAGTVGAVVLFAAVASISVAVPVLLFAVRGEAVLVPLARVRDWLLRHSDAILAVVIAVIGLVLIKNGVAGL